jgi:hypothetical protein
MKRILLLMVMVMLPVLAHAEPKTFANAKLSLDLPAGWKVTTDGNTTIAKAADGTATIAVAELDAVDRPALEALGKRFLKEVHWRDKTFSDEVHGVPVTGLEGEGVSLTEGKLVKVAGFFAAGADKQHGIVVLVYADEAGRDAHKKEVRDMLQTLAPAK